MGFQSQAKAPKNLKPASRATCVAFAQPSGENGGEEKANAVPGTLVPLSRTPTPPPIPHTATTMASTVAASHQFAAVGAQFK
jgi:hypothetical protein